MRNWTIRDFVRESNRIEGIKRDLTSMASNQQFESEALAHQIFIGLTQPTTLDLESFVLICTGLATHPAVLRRKIGQDVMVGNHIAAPGGPTVEPALRALLVGMVRSSESAFQTHLAYETLHPFTDGNGRSGRVLWLWQMGGSAPLGFLHQFYYQTLDASQKYRRGEQ